MLGCCGNGILDSQKALVIFTCHLFQIKDLFDSVVRKEKYEFIVQCYILNGIES